MKPVSPSSHQETSWSPAASFLRKWRVHSARGTQKFKVPGEGVQKVIADRINLEREKVYLSPLKLIPITLREVMGYGMVQTGSTILRGAGLLFYYPDPATGNHRFAFQITPVEWKDSTLPSLPALNMRIQLEFINGWIKAKIPVWGWVGILPSKLETQKLLMEPREDSLFMITRTVHSERGVVIQFSEE